MLNLFIRNIGKCFAIAIALLLPVIASAEQMQKLGNWDVHYLAFPSTFLTAKVAKNYDLQRSNYLGLVNISVLDSKTKAPQALKVTVTARNLLGNIRELEVRKITEQDAIYYLAEVPHRNEETYRFIATIDDGTNQQVLKFEQKFYVD